MEVVAKQAELKQLREQLNYLREQRERTRLHAPVEGMIVTPRLEFKTGGFLKEGDLFATVEDNRIMRAEILAPETDIGEVQPDAPVRLRVWASAITGLGLSAAGFCGPGGVRRAGRRAELRRSVRARGARDRRDSQPRWPVEISDDRSRQNRGWRQTVRRRFHPRLGAVRDDRDVVLVALIIHVPTLAALEREHSSVFPARYPAVRPDLT